jgi:hypothetical protein
MELKKDGWKKLIFKLERCRSSNISPPKPSLLDKILLCLGLQRVRKSPTKKQLSINQKLLFDASKVIGENNNNVKP